MLCLKFCNITIVCVVWDAAKRWGAICICNVFAITFISAPSSPPNITYNTTSESIALNWSPPPEGDRNGRITQYRVQVLGSGSTIMHNMNYSVDHQLGYAAHNLIPYTNYTCKVAAFTISEGPFVTRIIRTDESSEWMLFVGLCQTITYKYMCLWFVLCPLNSHSLYFWAFLQLVLLYWCICRV